MVDTLTKQKQEMQKFQEAEMLKNLDLRYKNELIRSMEWLGEKDNTIFYSFLLATDYVYTI